MWNKGGGGWRFLQEMMRTKEHPPPPQGPSFQETPPGTTWPEATLPHLQRQTDRASVIVNQWRCSPIPVPPDVKAPELHCCSLHVNRSGCRSNYILHNALTCSAVSAAAAVLVTSPTPQQCVTASICQLKGQTCTARRNF